ncbi:DNA ligase [Bacillus phage vB_BanS-Thrax3]|nr:DNA ligase [Bacillus phage vB_BanS-Thrax3]
MDINKIYGVFSQLQETSSKTGKEEILKRHKGDEDILKALDFLLNPFVVTGISTKKMKKKITRPETVVFPTEFDALINYINNNNSGRDIDVLAIRAYIDTLDEHMQEFVRKFVTKDLKLGISEKTVNKVYGKNTIPTFAVMLAESFAKKEAKVTGKFYVTLKLDGNRCVAIREGDTIKFFTRQGKAILDMVDLENQFMFLPSGYVYDGELLLVNKDNLPSDELFRATQKVVRKDGEKKDLEFHIFDMLPVEEFFDGKSKDTYEQRRNKLFTIEEHVYKQPNIHVLPVLYEGTNKEMISHLMRWVEENGHEGLMVNTADGLYLTKRTDGLLKVKKFKTADLLCVSVEHAIDGQFEGLMGRINVEYKGNLVGVGSGFTIDERRQYIANPDEIVGKIIEVQFFEESQDEKTGQLSLRFPVFKGIRHDKGIDDINYGE